MAHHDHALTSRLACAAALALAGSLAACAAPADEEVGAAEQAATTTNAVTTNAVTTNAVTTNAVTTNALLASSLTTTSLSTNPLLVDALQDPVAREFLTYVVSCALPRHESVSSADGTVYAGELGLAPQWGKPGGTCNAECQEWVSGCILARVDYLGVPLPISVRGEHPKLRVTGQERKAFAEPEATYYGNLFKSPQQRFACLAPGKTADPRVCGPSLSGCVVSFTGTCDDVCDGPAPDGAFTDCRANGREYEGAITVFLH